MKTTSLFFRPPVVVISKIWSTTSSSWGLPREPQFLYWQEYNFNCFDFWHSQGMHLECFAAVFFWQNYIKTQYEVICFMSDFCNRILKQVIFAKICKLCLLNISILKQCCLKHFFLFPGFIFLSLIANFSFLHYNWLALYFYCIIWSNIW